MELSKFTLKNIVCTLDYEIQLRMIDKKGEIISLFAEELPHYTIVDLNQVKMESADKTWNIVVTPNRYGQVSQVFDNIESFTNQVHKCVERLMTVLDRDSFTRVGIRAFYELKLSEAGEFLPIKNYFDIPGIDDKRLADLIHYQVSFETQKQRTVITIGQNRRGSEIFLVPDIHGITFRNIPISSLCDTLKELYHSAHEKYKGFALTI